MGTGNKLDPTRLKSADISKTSRVSALPFRAAKIAKTILNMELQLFILMRRQSKSHGGRRTGCTSQFRAGSPRLPEF